MKKNTILVILFLSLFSCKENDIVTKIINLNKAHISVQYKIDEQYYYSDGIDTTFTPYEVWAIKDADDSLKNGYIWVDNNYRPYNMIYTKGDFYLAIPPKNTTVLYRNFNEEIISKVDWIDIFLNPDILSKQINDANNTVYISDTIYDEKKSILLKIEFPSNDKGQKITNSYIFDKKSLTPEWSMMKIESPENIYFDELKFSDFKYDSVDKNILLERQEKILSANPVERNGLNSETARLEAMLHSGDTPSGFTGKYYSSGENFTLQDYFGKNVIIIDFWYTHCPPCVKAMPYLSQLSKKYKDKGLKIFGLNSVDNQKRSKKNLEKFLKNRSIDYDIIMIEPEVDVQYKINGYPSMYLIDKSGKISYVELGFNEKKYKELVKKVEEIIKN